MKLLKKGQKILHNDKIAIVQKALITYYITYEDNPNHHAFAYAAEDHPAVVIPPKATKNQIKALINLVKK